ncbi:MAG: hypothetical protein ABI375_03830 [Rudaea sp.]
MVRSLREVTIAPVVREMVLVAQPGLLVVNPLASTVSPSTATVTALRRLPAPVSLQLVTNVFA